MSHRLTMLTLAFVLTAAALAMTAETAHAQRAVKLAPAAGVVSTVAVSDTGLVAYTVRGKDKVHGLYILNYNAPGKPKRISDGIGADFAPDGSELVFYNDNKGDNLFWVTTITPEGKDAFEMGVQGKDPTSVKPIFSPDGKAIIYSNSEGTFIIPRIGQFTKRLSTTVLSDATWSPDGKSVLFVRKGGGISTMDVLSGSTRDLTPNFHGFNPRWAPDGSKILFTHELGVYVMDMATGKRKQAADGEGAEWTNSGKAILALRATGTVSGAAGNARNDFALHWVPLDNPDGALQLAKKAHDVAITPDGRTVVFGVINDGVYKVRLEKLDGESEAAGRIKSVRASAAVPAAAIPTGEAGGE